MSAGDLYEYELVFINNNPVSQATYKRLGHLGENDIGYILSLFIVVSSLEPGSVLTLDTPPQCSGYLIGR